MTPLVIDDTVKATIAKLVKFADERRMSFKEVYRRTQRNDPPGNDPNYCCFIPMGFKVVFTIEEQPAGWARHFSISSQNHQRTPNPEGVNMLLPLFGFRDILNLNDPKNSPKTQMVWLEDIHVNGELVPGKAINVLEFLEET